MIIHNYIYRQIASLTCFILLIVLLLTLTPQIIDYLNSILENNLSSDLLIQLILLNIPEILVTILPFCLFVATAITFNQMRANNEVTIMFGAGLPPNTLIKNSIIAAIPVILITASLSMLIRPYSVQKINDLITQQHKSLFKILSPYKFNRINKNDFLYVDKITADKSMAINVMFIKAANKQINMNTSILIKADYAQLTTYANRLMIKFIAGYIYKLQNKQETISKFAEHSIYLNQEQKSLSTMKSLALLSTRDLIKTSTNPRHYIELQWRAAMFILIPISIIILGPLSVSNNRSTRKINLLPSAMLYFFSYIAILNHAHSKLMQANNNEYFFSNLWLVHGMFLSISMLIIYSSNLANLYTRLFKIKK